jgi:hypothetical protein
VALYPYPPEFPGAEVWQLVADALRNRTVDLKESAHAVWHVSGYALSQWDEHPPVRGEAPAAPLTREQAAAFCESAAGGARMAGGWLVLLLPVLKELASELLEKLLNRLG